MKTIATFKWLIMLFIATIFACSDDDAIPDTGDERDKIVGTWNCSGEDPEFGKQTFKSILSKDPVNADRVLISNFHGFQGGEVYATLSGMTLTVPKQATGGWEVVGKGTVQSGYNEIDWTYTIDEGDGTGAKQASATFSTRVIAFDGELSAKQ